MNAKKLARAQVRLSLLQARVNKPDPRTSRTQGEEPKVKAHPSEAIAIDRARAYCKKRNQKT